MEQAKLASYVEQGLSIREIASKESLGYSTVRYWLQKHGFQTQKLETQTQHLPLGHGSCEWHLCKMPRQVTSKFCSRGCANKFYVDRRRKDIKARALDYKGGKCQLCGYDRCSRALQFHHLEPEHKDFGISTEGVTRAWSKVKTELDKCALLCSNCHAEVHEGLVTL